MALGPGPAGLKFWSPPGITADNTADINNLPASVGEQFRPWGPKRPVQDWVWGNLCLYPPSVAITFPAAAGSYALTGSDAALTTSAIDTTNLPAGITNWFNPWGRKRPVQDWFRGPIPAVPVILPASSGSYTLTGTAAALAFGHVAASSSYSITGSAAALALGHVAGAGSYTLTGSSAALALGLGAGAGSYTLTGSAAGFVLPFTLTAAAGSYTLTGADAAFVIPGGVSYLPAGLTGGFNPWGRSFPVNLRTITGRGLAAPTAITLTAAAGSYVLTGADAALTTASGVINLPAGMTGGYVPWGRPPRQDWIWSVAYVSGVTGTTLSAGAGAYALSGSAAELTATNFQYIFRPPLITRLWSRSRQVSISAQNWVTRSQRLGDVQLPANAGSYAVTGSSAGWALALTANAGSYTLTGFATVPLTGLGAAAGSYALTGATAGFIGGGTGVVITAATGSYAITGTAAVLATAFPFSAASGSYALTGAAANLATPGFLVAGAGAYAITGTDAQLVQAGTITLTCGSGSYLLTGGAAVSFISAAPPTVEQPGGNYTGGVSRGRMIRRRKRGELDIEPPPDLEPPRLSPYPPDLKPPIPGPKPPDLLPPQPSLLASMPQVKPAKILEPALEDDEDEDEIALLLELLSRL